LFDIVVPTCCRVLHGGPPSYAVLEFLTSPRLFFLSIFLVFFLAVFVYLAVLGHKLLIDASSLSLSLWLVGVRSIVISVYV